MGAVEVGHGGVVGDGLAQLAAQIPVALGTAADRAQRQSSKAYLAAKPLAKESNTNQVFRPTPLVPARYS